MKLKVINSGSSGNCYLLTNNKNETLMIECGLPFPKLSIEIINNIGSWKNIAGGCCTHLHRQDHSTSLEQCRKLRLQFYCTDNLKPLETVNIKGFKIKAIPTTHWSIDRQGNRVYIDCYGYVIDCDSQRVVFLTDSSEIPFTSKIVKPIDLLMIEVNHCNEIIQEQIINGTPTKSNYEAHLSLGQVSEWLNNLEVKPKNILACHLSSENADRKMIQEILEQYCDNVFIAEKGTEIEICNI